MNSTLKRLKTRLDAMALEQLRDVAAQLYEELEQARADRDRAEENADWWREQVLGLQEQLADDDSRSLGMDITGALHIVNS